jgi:UDP-N-acetylmuramoylalanine--D-glutamate ligase
MIPVSCFCGQQVVLFGLGGSGLATALALLEGGARVLAWDDGVTSREKAAVQGSHKGIEVVDWQSLTQQDWLGLSALVLSPGIPLTHPEPHPVVRKVQEYGIEIIGDIELFCRERRHLAPQAPFIAITGTNGKSTTTALIAHLLREAGWPVEMGGNIGTPALALTPPDITRVHVLECSSFQIDLAPSLDPTIGVHLNLSPDHLDRHGTMEAYAAIKERLVARADHAVIGMDDESSRAMAARAQARGQRLTRISGETPVRNGIFGAVTVKDRWLETHLVRIAEDKPRTLVSLEGIASLRGAHNAQNASAALAACLALGLEENALLPPLATYPGLPHRMEEVLRREDVLFINDSKATNAESTEKALSAFEDIFWIAGGKAKEGGIAALERFFPRIRKAYLIGSAEEAFAQTLQGKVLYERCGTLDRAVMQASQDALACKTGVVLLSPACASYDQFRNFEERGERFRQRVQQVAKSG